MIILDDHSRMIVGRDLFYHDNACNFQKVLKGAVATYGIPTKLYCDHGVPYNNEQLSLICGQTGICLLYAPVRDVQQKQSVSEIFAR